jgi:hypothetical protein
MNRTEAYDNGFNYEIFIARAHRVYDRDAKTGADVSYMKNLINTENGVDLSRLLGSYEKQFIKVKGFISKALDKYFKMELNDKERQELELLKTELSRASSSKDLIAIVNRGLDATERFIEN